jgi:hypothetical protein
VSTAQLAHEARDTATSTMLAEALEAVEHQRATIRRLAAEVREQRAA